MGKPTVVARRGMLPELVEDGETGFLVDDTPDNLYKAIRCLIQNSRLRMEMGIAAQKKARMNFRLDKQAEGIEAFYRRILDMGPR